MATENRPVEDALRESEERLRVIFEASQSGIIQVDTEWRILFANRRMAEMFASSMEELIGSSYVDHLHESERSVGEALMKQLASGEIDHVYTERRYIRKDGSDFWGYLSGRRLEGSDGTLKGLVGNITDITERKRLQEIMAQTEKMLMLGGLAAGMSHELNNPLGAILQNSQNIQRRISPGLPANETIAKEIGLDFSLLRQYMEKRGITELLNHITTAGTRAADIIANMLAFSRKGAAMLEATPFPQLIDKAVELASCDYDLKKKYDFRTISIKREYDMTLPPVVMNRPEIEQALLNIVKNAAQALAERPADIQPQIILRTRRAGQYAVIEVADNGPGMSQEIARRVFDPFFSTKEIGVGTGLGLSVAYALVVNNHRGMIGLDSNPGKGATFTISLPLNCGDAARRKTGRGAHDAG